MVKLANRQTVELWHYLRQGFEEIMNSDENRLPVKSVNQVSPSYKFSVLVCFSNTTIEKYTRN